MNASTLNEFKLLSRKYAVYRPSYPDVLYEWIAKITHRTDIVLDVGTGNGQAARDLAKHFKKVIAIDRHKSQLLEAPCQDNITYLEMDSSSIDLPPQSVNVITAASSLHWFDLEKFYEQCKKVLVKNGLIIAWTYSLPEEGTQNLSVALSEIKNYLLPCFDTPSLYHINKYEDLPFPFQKISTPRLKFNAQWDIREFIGFLSSWPSISLYTKEKNIPVLDDIRSILKKFHISETEKLEYCFPLYIKAGRV